MCIKKEENGGKRTEERERQKLSLIYTDCSYTFFIKSVQDNTYKYINLQSSFPVAVSKI